MKGFKTISLVGALFVAVLAAGVKAQPASTPVADRPAQNAVAAAPVAPAPVETEETSLPVSEVAPTFFHIGPLPVTNTIVCTWIVVAVILVIVRLSTWKMKEIPSRGQNVMELLVEGWEDLTGSVLEPRVRRWVFPYAVTFFLFIFLSNLVDLLPGIGSIGWGVPNKNSLLPFGVNEITTPFFRPPTSDANLTVAMTLIFFVMSTFWALRYNGFIGFVKHIFGVKVKVGKWLFPPLLLLFIFIGLMEVISIVIVRPVALAMRLFGNIYGGENILDIMLSHKPLALGILSALPFYFYELLISLVQAFVFAMLTVAFVGTMCSSDTVEKGSH